MFVLKTGKLPLNARMLGEGPRSVRIPTICPDRAWSLSTSGPFQGLAGWHRPWGEGAGITQKGGESRESGNSAEAALSQLKGYQWEKASLRAQLVKNPPAMQETLVQFLGQEDPLEKGKATHSSILAWRILWTMQSMGSQRVRHNWVTFTFTFQNFIFPRSTLTFLYTSKMPSNKFIVIITLIKCINSLPETQGIVNSSKKEACSISFGLL